MFVLIGLAVFVGTVLGVLFNPGSASNCMTFGWGTGVVWNIVGLVVTLGIIFLIFRGIMRRHGGCGCGCCGSNCECKDEGERKGPARRRSR